MMPENNLKTAATTLNGHDQYSRMAKGLRNARSIFQRLMEQLLRGVQNKEMLIYLDDIIFYAKNLHDHNQKVRELFRRLRESKLVLEPDKVEFLRREVPFLGHIVSERGREDN